VANGPNFFLARSANLPEGLYIFKCFLFCYLGPVKNDDDHDDDDDDVQDAGREAVGSTAWI